MAPRLRVKGTVWGKAMLKRISFPTAVLLFVVAANGITVPLGDSGWEAVFQEEDNVGIFVNAVLEDRVIIQISKEFKLPPDENGQFPPVLIRFNQTALDAVPKIVIDDEDIFNNTGVDWTDFHWAVLDAGDAFFNVAESEAFDVTPFAQKEFNDPVQATELAAFDGVVPFGDTFTPGVLAGQLVIDAFVSQDPNDFTSFVFKQFPTPEPATVLLLAAGGLLARRRIG